MVFVRHVETISVCLILRENVWWDGKVYYGSEEKVVTRSRVDVSTCRTPGI
jgi:hypothetical protein